MSGNKYKGADLSTVVFGSNGTHGSVFMSRMSVITKEEALLTGRQFAEQVRKRIDPDALVFVFGSVIKGTAHTGSDIDIAVVSKNFDNDIIREGAKLSSLAQSISWDIEVHAIAITDWCKGDPHVFEVKRWGIPV